MATIKQQLGSLVKLLNPLRKVMPKKSTPLTAAREFALQNHPINSFIIPVINF